MNNIFEFNGYKPYIHPTAFIHPMACVIGNVSIGKNVFIGSGAVIRGDWGEIIIEDGCNVQENCIIHMFPGTTVWIKASAHIGHGAIIHGGIIGKNTLVGMNSVIMDNVEIGDECIIGALTLVPQEMKIPARKVVVGNPAKIVKDVSDEMIAWKTEGTKLYQQLPKECYETLKPCEPLREKPVFKKPQMKSYITFKELQKQK
jgi:phenylacetic acid degradation protein